MIVDLYKKGRNGLFVPHGADVDKIIAAHKPLNKFKGISPQKIDLDDGPLIGVDNKDIEKGFNNDGYYVAEAEIATEEKKSR